ncbi:hypothetical protein F0Z19_3587 [Vibrio cyclitrophicus]|nr:hypothetical protein F0Z19_3587 [Vibrio cyclitrophicus]
MLNHISTQKIGPFNCFSLGANNVGGTDEAKGQMQLKIKCSKQLQYGKRV